MAGEIDNINFKVIINDKEFDKQLTQMEAAAKRFNTSVSQMLDLSKKLSGTTAQMSQSQARMAAAQTKAEETARREAEKTAAARVKGEQQVQREMAKTASALKINAEREQQAAMRTTMVRERLNRMRQQGNAQLSESSRLLKELTGYAAAYFSVRTVESFVSSLIRVSGEFELQRRTLQAIVGDVDSADRIFSKLQTLAVKSPFSFADLTSYAKQLSAFSIPTEELYETTKRLADVSAGLGVDMGRIILAFGQIRSASFLRGQEVRQLTEAGVPILEDLAKQFEEIEGRAVSVGEVFDKISLREVPFEMVEKVFKDMTSEGGKFYNMQEVQAETLKAKVKNLGDQYDIMLYQIGQAQEGVLKGSVGLIASLMENWQSIGRTIMSVAAGLGAYAGVLAGVAAYKKVLVAKDSIEHLTRLISHFGSLTKGVSAYATAMERAGKSTRAAFAGTILGIITAIGVGIYQIVRSAGELDRTLNRIVNEKMSAAERSANTLAGIVDRLEKAAKGTQDYRDALHDLNAKYGEFLPNLMTEKNSLDEIRTAADGAAEALRNKARASALAAGQDEIDKKYGKGMQSLEDTIVNNLQSANRSLNRQSAQDIFDLFLNNLESGNFGDGGAAFTAAVNSYLGTSGLLTGNYNAVSGAATAYARDLKKRNAERAKLERRLAGSDSPVPMTRTEREGYNAMEAYYKERKQAIGRMVLSEDETAEQLKELEKARLRNLILFYGGEDVKLTDAMTVKGVNRPDLANKAKADLAALDDRAMGRARLVQEALASVGITKKTSAFGLWADNMTDFGNDGYYKQLDEQYKDVIPTIQRAKESFVKLVGTDFDSADYAKLNDEGKAAYDNMKKLLLRKKAINAIADALGYNIDDSRRARAARPASTPKNPQLDALKAERDAIEDIRKTYDALRPYMNEDNVTMKKVLSGMFPDADAELMSTLDFDAALRRVASEMDRYGAAGQKAGNALRESLTAKSAMDQAKDMADGYKASAVALEKVEEMLEKIRATTSGLYGEDLGLGVNKIVDSLRIEDNKADLEAKKIRDSLASGELEYVELHGRQAWEKYRDEALASVDAWAAAEKRANHDVAQDRLKQLGTNFVQKYLKGQGYDISRLDKKSLSELSKIISAIKDGLSDDAIAAMIPQDVVEKADELGISLQAILDLIEAARDAQQEIVDEKLWEKLKSHLSEVASQLESLGAALSSFGRIGAGIGSAFTAAGGIVDSIGKFYEVANKIQTGKGLKANLDSFLGGASMAVSGISSVLSTIGNQIEENRRAQKEWEQAVLETELAYNTLRLDRMDYEESNVFGSDAPLERARHDVETYETAAEELLGLYARLEDEGRVQTGTKKVASGKNIASGAAGGALAGLGAGAAYGAAVGGALGVGVLSPVTAGIGALVGGIASLFGAKKTVKVYTSLIDKYGSILDRSEGAGPFDLNPKILDDYNKLDDTTKQIVDNWKEIQEKMTEIENNLKEDMKEWAGDIGTQLKDALVDAFENGDVYSAIDNFHDYVTKVLENLIAQTIIAAVFKDQLDQLQEDLTNSIYHPEKVNYRSWEDILGDFGNSLEQGIPKAFEMLEYWQNWGAQRGYKLFSSGGTSSSLSDGVKSITEDTASLLASYINAMRADVSVMRIGQEAGWTDVKTILSLMPSPSVWEHVAKIEAHTFDIAQTSAEVAASNASILSELRGVITSESGQSAVRALMQ